MAWRRTRARGAGRGRRVAAWGLGLAVALGLLIALGLAARPWVGGLGLEARGSEAYERRDWGGSAALARERLKTAPADPAALRLLARSSARLGRDDVARNVYARVNAAAWEPEDHFLLGRVIDRAGQPDLAIKTWELALAGAPGNPEVLDALVAAYRSSGLIEGAADLAARLGRVPGWEARGAVLLGDLKAEFNDPAAAAEAYRRALSLGPPRPEPNDTPARGDVPPPDETAKRLARALLRLGKPAEATAALGSAGVAPGADLEADWLFGRAALQAGDAAAPVHERAAEYRAAHPAAPEPAPFTGSAACTRCHRPEARAVAGGMHARTFRRAGELALTDPALAPTPTAQPDPDAPGRVAHTLRRDGDALRFESRIDGRLARAVVEYAFGSGDRGLTLVGRDPVGRPCELRLSHYADVHGWDVTNGQDARPKAAEGYLGKVLTADLARRCLDCHTTDARSVRERVGPAAADRAIGCEKCHGPGGHHAAAVEAGLPDLAIAAGSKKPSAAEVVGLCGQCHAVRGTPPARDNPYSVRFQADTLTWSRCYTESNGGLSCLTCHDPHRDADPDHSRYDARCLSCHAAGATAKARTVCPVNPKADCVRCHMPPERTPVVGHTRFTHHHIRVHRD